MHSTLSHLLLFAATGLSSPLLGKPKSTPKSEPPVVELIAGKVVGHLANDVESFNGIPFADPPVKDLRLRPPKPLSKPFGTVKSTKNPRACPQFYFQVRSGSLPANALGTVTNLPLLQAVQDSGEDCLTINVIRPPGTNSTSKLPVLFWIFGGGFELGSTQQYDGSQFVARSIELNEPVVWVAVNYRVAGFGFLAGKELAANGSTNLGLRDQRLGMQWTAENIAQFGGDPDKVTIWGESAGAISVYDHLIINGGDHTYNGKPLFRAAIMNCGSAVPTEDVSSPQAQEVYDTVVNHTDCSKETDTLACLREAPYTNLHNAMNSVPGLLGHRALDLSYLPRPDPGDNFFPESPEVPGLAGRWPKVPLIIGDQEDEGTLFGLFVGSTNMSTNAEVVNYLGTYFPTNPNAKQLVTGLMANYPDEPTIGQPHGSPFNTNDENNIYPQFKRLSAVLGDIVFTLPRRILLEVASDLTPTWSYMSTILRGTPVLGTCHGSDLFFDFGLIGVDKYPTIATQTYYMNFIYNLDPNVGAKNESLVAWPKYNKQKRPLLEFGKNYTQMYPGGDTFREQVGVYLRENIPKFRV